MNACASVNGFEKILDSAVYKTDLERTVAAILSQCTNNDTEATIASVFENELYHFIKVQFGISIKWNKESGKNYFRHAFKGRIDAFSNGFVIEYKRPTKLSISADQRTAVEQAEGYLRQLNDSHSACNGLVTDGRRVCFLFWNGKELRNSGFTTISVASADRIVRALIGSEEKAFTADNVLRDFSLKNKDNPTYKLSQILFTLLMKNPAQRTSMLYEEWLALFHLSDNDSGKNKDIVERRKVLGKYFNVDMSRNDIEYRGLFALQTTYAIVIKLMACKAIGKLAYDNDIQYFSDLVSVDSKELQDFLNKLEDGYVYTTKGVRNLLEGDFFSWYCSTSQWNIELFEPIKQIVAQVELYASTSDSRVSTLDIFKDLYMDFIPQEVRHSLGEYYTPDWLADHIVEKSISLCHKKNSWRGIDPCCGSGVFILKMVDRIIGERDIKSLSDEDKHALLMDILDRVAGIDINPLSALTTRVNLFLAICDLIQPGDNIEIPIYVGDAAVIATSRVLGGIPCYEYRVDTTKKSITAVLPKKFVESRNFLKTMSGIQTYVKANDASVLLLQLREAIPPECLNSEVEAALKSFADDLVLLHSNDWDGIWVRIVSNFMLIARITDRDIIVGNPPWVKWEYLPERYASRLKDACLEKNMFSGQTYMGAISLNICAAISIMTASAWLSDNGVLGFLMPENLLTQDSYEGFRNFRLAEPHSGERLYLQFVEEWSKAGKLFGKSSYEPCASFYYSRTKIDYYSGFPVKRISKKRSSSWVGITRWQEAAQCFEETDCIGAQIDPRRTGYTIVESNKSNLIASFQKMVGTCAYRGRTGVEFVPDEVMFLEPIASTGVEGEWTFKNLELKASLHKTVSHDETTLETAFVRPLLTAPEIKEFAIDDSGRYCIFPYLEHETYCCPLDKLAVIAPKTGAYLLNNQDLFVQQSERSKRMTRGNAFYALSKVGQYTYATNMVVIRDNTKMCASVVEPRKTPWGVNAMPIPAKHAAIIATHAGKKETPISQDEAYYVAGIFNTSIVQSWFDTTYSKRSYSIKFGFKVPLYDPNDDDARRIVLLSKRAHESAKKDDLLSIKAYKKAIEDHYLHMCSRC